MENSEFAEQMKTRTKKAALSIIFLQRNLPKSPESWVIRKQLIRSATSVAANYRAACRARSRAEFYAKLSITIEEADETVFWLELLIDAALCEENIVKPILKESTEILKIVARARKSTKK